MRKATMRALLGLGLALLLVACQDYLESGGKYTSRQSADGGSLAAEIDKVNGTGKLSIDTEGGAGRIQEADVTLAVGLGSYKIELLGEDDAVPLTLEAGAGETVKGHGQMVTNSSGEATYRVTAKHAENVDYQIVYSFH